MLRFLGSCAQGVTRLAEEIVEEEHKQVGEYAYVKKVEIQPDWTWQIDGSYSYIRERVKNTGNRIVTYFKLSAAYLDDSGNVLDTAHTNSIQKLRPGWSKEFKIMHHHREEYKQVNIWIEKVSIE